MKMVSIKETKIYYPLTKTEALKKQLIYKKDSRYDGKAVNTSYKGMIQLISEEALENELIYYVVLPLDIFRVNTNIEINTDYPMISIETPFTIDLVKYKPKVIK